MSQIVSSFDPINIEGYSYLFFIVTWNDFVTDIKNELEKQADPFGEALGLKGSVIRAFNSMKAETYTQVASKKWPSKLIERMEKEQDPFMLIINRKFKEFDPKMHSWSVIWFSDFREKPDSIYRLLGALAQKVKRDEDLFQYLESVTRKSKLKKFASYVEIKTPSIIGVAIDVKAILLDLFE